MTPTKPLGDMHAGFTKIYEGLAEVLTAVRQCEEATLEWAEHSIGDADIHRFTAAQDIQTKQPEPTEDTPDPVEPDPKPTEDETGVTFVQLRMKLADLVKTGHRLEVKQMLTNAGYSKLSDVPEQEYQTLFDAAEAVTGKAAA